MPKLAQYLGEVLPITHFIRITRGIMLRDASIFELRNEIFMLLGFTVIAMTAAVMRFSRRLD
jgi:ABC-2 type transport system permease protein